MWPYVFTNFKINCSAMSRFCSFDMPNPSIPLLSGSRATPHNQIYSEEPALIKVSSVINSSIFFLFDNIFLGLYF